jgi:hypothetical protein
VAKKLNPFCPGHIPFRVYRVLYLSFQNSAWIGGLRETTLRIARASVPILGLLFGTFAVVVEAQRNSPFSPHEKAFYADAAVISFVRFCCKYRDGWGERSGEPVIR